MEKIPHRQIILIIIYDNCITVANSAGWPLTWVSLENSELFVWPLYSK